MHISDDAFRELAADIFDELGRARHGSLIERGCAALSFDATLHALLRLELLDYDDFAFWHTH